MAGRTRVIVVDYKGRQDFEARVYERGLGGILVSPPSLYGHNVSFVEPSEREAFQKMVAYLNSSPIKWKYLQPVSPVRTYWEELPATSDVVVTFAASSILPSATLNPAGDYSPVNPGIPARLLEERCEECKGSGTYVGLNAVEVCAKCNGRKWLPVTG